MLALLFLACAPRLYSDEPQVWSAPDNTWPATDALPDDLRGEGFAVGQVIPELVGLDQHGDSVSLWQFYGEIMILDISTMWCAPCQDLAEHVDETQAHYAEDGVVYVTVLPQNLDGTAPTVEELAFWGTEFGVTAPIIEDDVDWYRDAVPTNTFPQLMVIDRELRVYARDIAANDPAVREQVDALLLED